MSQQLAKNIKHYLNQTNTSPATLAQHSGIDKARISRLLSGKTTNPQIETLKPIADFFNISLDELVGHNALTNGKSHGIVIPIKRLLIPVIAWKHITYWLNIKDQYLADETIDVTSHISPDSFALTIEDNEYQPLFRPQETLIVDPHTTAKNRDLLLIQNNDEIRIMQLLIDNENYFLKNINNQTITKTQPPQHYGVITESHQQPFRKT